MTKITRYDPSYPTAAGRSISYRCNLCGDVLPSMPKHAVVCKCEQLGVDSDAGRVWANRPSQVSILWGGNTKPDPWLLE